MLNGNLPRIDSNASPPPRGGVEKKFGFAIPKEPNEYAGSFRKQMLRFL